VQPLLQLFYFASVAALIAAMHPTLHCAVIQHVAAVNCILHSCVTATI